MNIDTVIKFANLFLKISQEDNEVIEYNTLWENLNWDSFIRALAHKNIEVIINNREQFDLQDLAVWWDMYQENHSINPPGNLLLIQNKLLTDLNRNDLIKRLLSETQFGLYQLNELNDYQKDILIDFLSSNDFNEAPIGFMLVSPYMCLNEVFEQPKSPNNLVLFNINNNLQNLGFDTAEDFPNITGNLYNLAENIRIMDQNNVNIDEDIQDILQGILLHGYKDPKFENNIWEFIDLFGKYDRGFGIDPISHMVRNYPIDDSIIKLYNEFINPYDVFFNINPNSNISNSYFIKNKNKFDINDLEYIIQTLPYDILAKSKGGKNARQLFEYRLNLII